jgi:ribosomal protein L37AE/L43A
MSKKKNKDALQTTTCPECASVVVIELDNECAICQSCGMVWAYTT